MDQETLSQLLSSRSKLKIADLLSTRPRTLKELSALTGISVQGVIKHLNSLEKIGLLQEKGIKGKELNVRRIYSLKGAIVHDFSLGELKVIKSADRSRLSGSKRNLQELESLAEDRLVLEQRVKERTRKLGRVIDDYVALQKDLVDAIESINLTDEERLMVLVLFTEETRQDAEEVLKKVHGIRDPKQSIDRILAKVKAHDKK